MTSAHASAGPCRVLTEAELAALGSRAWNALLREHGTPSGAFRAAQAEGLVPLVAMAGGDQVPARCLPLSTRGCRAALGRQGLIAAAMQEAALAISARLGSAGIPHAFLKGAALAPLYGVLSARPMSDIDVLVGEAHIADAVLALAPLGYGKALASELEVVLVQARPGATMPALDLHRRLGYAGQFDFPVEEMLVRARERARLPVLAPEDEMLALAAHVACHRFRAVGRSLCDIAAIALACGADWDAVVERGRSWRVSAAAWASFTCARRVFGAPIPRGALEGLRPGAAQEAYLRLWLDLSRISPWRFSSRGYGDLARRAALVVLWPALSDGLLRGAAFAARYSLRTLAARPDCREALRQAAASRECRGRNKARPDRPHE